MKLLDRNFLVRTASAVVFAVILIGAALIADWSFLALLAVIMCGSMVELHRMARRAGYEPMQKYPLVIGLLLLVIAASSNPHYLIHQNLHITPLAVVVLLPLMVVAELFRNKPAPLANLGVNMLSLIYISLPLTLLTFLPAWGKAFDGWIFLYFIFMVWANDVGAYIFGVLLGRHKLMERISPKKSWEGFFGGVLLAMAVGAIIGGTASGAGWIWAGTGRWIGAGAVIAVTSVAGDLVESMFKRSVDLKDSGKMMPGHGGFLDRFDSVFVSAPFAFAWFILSGII